MLPPELEPLVAADRRASLGSDTERQAIYARVLDELGMPPPGSGGAAPPVAGGGTASGGAKALLIVALVTGGGIAGYFALRGTGEAAVSRRAEVTAPAAVTLDPPSRDLTLQSRAPRITVAPPDSSPATGQPPAPQSQDPNRAKKADDRTPSQSATTTPRRVPTAEEVLIEEAWSAHARNEPTAASALLVEHEEQYPHGRLAEERDALRVLVLAEARRLSEARERAASFEAAYPRSIHLAAIQDALRNVGEEP